MEKGISGKTELSYTIQNQTLQLTKLFPLTQTDEATSLDDILSQWSEKKVPIEPNVSLLQWYLDKAQRTEQVFSNLIVASGRSAVKMNSPYLKFTDEDFLWDDEVYWSFVYNLFKDFDEIDLTQPLPFKLLYVKENDVIATKHISAEDVAGQAITGEVLSAGRLHNYSFYPGDNVVFNDIKQVFIATTSGYVFLYDNKLTVRPPFYVSEDQMVLHYINFDRTPAVNITKKDIANFFAKNKLDVHSLCDDFDIDTPIGTSAIVARGKYPTESRDAELQFMVDIETKHSEVDEQGNINYREIQKFPSIAQDDLLAKKIKAQRGENGSNLYGKPLAARNPRDIPIKNGMNVYKKETDDEVLFYSNTDGLIEYKHYNLAIIEQLFIIGDVDFATGNIDTRVNVHINGTVRTGFKVKSERNIFIKGMIEDNCIVESGGDLIVNGGSSGQNNTLICNGNMAVKFVEGGRVFVKGKLSVQRYILSAEVECLDTITVMGAGINLEEQGAIVDSKIFIKNDLFCPTIGNDASLKTFITFAYDKTRNVRTKNLEDTLTKIKDAVEDLNKKFVVDLNSPTINTKIKHMPPELGAEIQKGIIEKNKLDNQYTMMEGMLQKEIEKKKEDMANSNIQILRKVFAPLYLECEGIKRVIDQNQPPSRYFFDMDNWRIERTRYAMGNLDGGEVVNSEVKS